MLQRFGTIGPMIYVRPLLSTNSEKKLKTYLFAQAYPPQFLLFPVSLRGADPCYVSGKWL